MQGTPLSQAEKEAQKFQKAGGYIRIQSEKECVKGVASEAIANDD